MIQLGQLRAIVGAAASAAYRMRWFPNMPSAPRSVHTSFLPGCSTGYRVTVEQVDRECRDGQFIQPDEVPGEVTP